MLRLFNSLFQADVCALFFESKRIATSQGKFLRVRLRNLDPQLAALPWEYLFDARQDEYLCLAHSTPLIRYLAVAQPPQPQTRQQARQVWVSDCVPQCWWSLIFWRGTGRH